VEISRRTGVPASKIFSVATFYNAFSLRPRGRHCVGVCMGTPCHVKGAPAILGALERALGIKNGQTDENLNFTLTTTGCVGTCGIAPVVVIDDEMYGNVKQAQIPRILKRYREEGDK
jgi:NADH:ubiquinone oxidoreductase subunit E